MFKNRPSLRFAIVASVLIALAAITVTATRGTQFAFIDSVQEFFGMASVTTPTRTAAPTLFFFTNTNFYWNATATTTTSGSNPNVTAEFLASQGNNNGTTTMITTTSASSGYTGASGTSNFGAAAFTGAHNSSTSTYFSINVNPTSGTKGVAINSISFGSRSTGTGPTVLGVYSSRDNYAAPIGTSTASANSTWALHTITLTQPTTLFNGGVTLRIYGSDGTGSPSAGTANWRIDDITLNVDDFDAAFDLFPGGDLTFPSTAVGSATAGQMKGLEANSSLVFIDCSTSSPHFQLSMNGTSGWTTFLSYVTAGIEPLYTRFRPTATGSLNAVITCTSGATTRTFNVSGTATPDPPTINLNPSTAFDFGNVNVGTSSSNTSSSLTGSGLTDTLTCTASSGDFELSPNGTSSWSSSLGFSPSGGSVSATVFIRFVPTATGSIAGNVTCSSTGATNAVRNLSGTGFTTLNVSLAGSGTGTVTSGDSAINCGTTCSANYTSSVALVHMTATPALGSVFTGWSGACTGTGTCNFQMTANRSLTANFVAAPTVTSVSPATGLTTGGAVVGVIGTNFTGATAVTFDGLTCTIGTVTATTIWCTTPTHAPGAVDVAVTTPGGTGTGTGVFTYVKIDTALADLTGPATGLVGIPLSASTTLTRTTPPVGVVGGVPVAFTLTDPSSGTSVVSGNTSGFGVAIANLPLTMKGAHSIVANYAGGTHFNPSTSNTRTVNVYQRTSLAFSGGSATVGTPISLSATLTRTGSGDPIPTETVIFDFGGVIPNETATTNASGIATVNVTFPTSGTVSTTASFSNLPAFYANSAGALAPTTATANVNVAPPVPTMTTNAASAIGPNVATLNAAMNDNGDPATGWFRYDTNDPGTCNDTFGTRLPASGGALSTNGPTYSFVASGLAPATTYFYCAIGSNAGGTGFGSVLSFTTPPAIPAVTTAAATSVTSSGATLNGSANPGGAATTGWFRYSTTSPGTCNDTFGSRAPTTGGSSLGSGNSTVGFSEAISILTPATTYFYCAIAQNSAGMGFGAVQQFTTSAAAPTITTNAASAVTATGATLNATMAANGALSTGWFRYSATDPVTCNDTFGTRVPVTGGALSSNGPTYSFVISSLLPATTYYYCAIADNSVGTSFGAVLSFTTPAAQPVVTTNAATLVTTTTATLNGSANPGGAATTGWFRYSTTSPGTCNDTFGSRAPTTGGSSLGSGNSTVGFSEAISILTPATTYFYCAIAQNSIGTGLGTVMQFTTPAIIETGATSDAGGNIVITDANGGVSTDTISLTRNGGNVRISSNNTISAGGTCTQFNATTVDCPFVAGGSITVNSLAGNDTLTVDLSNGDVIPDGGISFNGGDPTAGPGDKLNIIGGTATTQTFNFTNEHDGSVVLSGLGTISYTGLEPVSSTVNAANVELNYSTATETITVSQDGGAPAQTLVDSNVGGESVSFLNPTTSLTINGGDTGDDTINVNGFGTSGGGFTANLTINGGTGNDTVNIATGINFASGNNLNVDLQDDNASPGVDQFNLTSGTLALTGTGSATIKVSQQATFVGNVSTVDGGITIEANQQLSPTAGNFRGVTLNTGSLITTGTGNILVKGRGGDDAATGSHRGVFLTGGAIVSLSAAAGAGTITVNGTGGGGTVTNRGVEIFNSASVSSVVGDISITGFGSTAGTTTGNSGVVVNTNGAVTSTGSAKVTINGTGGSGTSSNHGVTVQNDNAVVTSSGGDISIIGVGGAGTTTSNNGALVVNGARVAATGGAKVTINGTGGTGTSFIYGVGIDGFNTTTSSATTISSDSGDISIIGIGGTGAGFGHLGINMTRGSQIVATNAAKITMTGTGMPGTSDNYGVGIDTNNQAGTKVQSANGDIEITGTAGASAGTDMDGVRFEDAVGAQPVSIVTTGSGQLTVTGTAGNTDATSSGIQIPDDTTITLAGAANSFIADSMDIGASAVSINAGVNAVNLRQKTNGVGIDLGGPDVLSGGPLMLGLTDAELDRITAGTINIGDANTGDIPVTATITRPASTVMSVSSGAIVSIQGGQIDSGGGNITATPSAAGYLFVGNSGVDATTGAASTFKVASGRTLRIYINTPTVDTGYSQLNVAGMVDITGTSLFFAGGSVATAGASYTIINNDSNDAITGEFTGLPDEFVITNFLGSGLNARIDYQGGDGNDCVITMLAALPEIQFSSATYIEDESQTATVTVTRSGDLTNPSTVSFNAIAAGGATVGATCTPTADYAVIGTALPRTLTFGTNVGTQTVQFAVCGDTVIDPGEGLNLSLSSLTNATPGTQMTAVLDFNDTASRFLSTIPHEPIDMTLGSAAVPYASTITVAGAPNIIGGMRVTLYDIWHDTPDNIDVLLVGPQNQKYILMADVGGPFSIGQGAPVTLTFSDIAPAVLGDSATLVTGLYRPTTCETPVLNFFGPAPVGPYVEPGCTLARPANKTLFGTPPTGFGMTNPNGTWRLFVRDDNGSLRPIEAMQTTVGSISGGWGLEFFAPTAADASISGRVLTGEGRGIRGARVTVTGNSLSQPITVSTGVNGRYTIPGLTPGETYVVTVSARRFFFEAPSRVITLNDNVTDADFTGSAGTARDQ